VAANTPYVHVESSILDRFHIESNHPDRGALFAQLELVKHYRLSGGIRNGRRAVSVAVREPLLNPLKNRPIVRSGRHSVRSAAVIGTLRGKWGVAAGSLLEGQSVRSRSVTSRHSVESRRRCWSVFLGVGTPRGWFPAPHSDLNGQKSKSCLMAITEFVADETTRSIAGCSLWVHFRASWGRLLVDPRRRERYQKDILRRPSKRETGALATF
jgi:hypothetical protein